MLEQQLAGTVSAGIQKTRQTTAPGGWRFSQGSGLRAKNAQPWQYLHQAAAVLVREFDF